MTREEFENRWGFVYRQVPPQFLEDLKEYWLSLPPAEGASPSSATAEEILDKYWHKGNSVKKAALKAMTEFATLHAQKIADKMVSERLRKELIKYDDYRRGGDGNYPYSTRLVDEYLKSRER